MPRLTPSLNQIASNVFLFFSFLVFLFSSVRLFLPKTKERVQNNWSKQLLNRQQQQQQQQNNSNNNNRVAAQPAHGEVVVSCTRDPRFQGNPVNQKNDFSAHHCYLNYSEMANFNQNGQEIRAIQEFLVPTPTLIVRSDGQPMLQETLLHPIM